MSLKSKIPLLVLFLLLFAGYSMAQSDSIQGTEKKLMELLKETRAAKEDSTRIALNERFADMLAETLTLSVSRAWPFDSLKIGKLTSKTGNIRIFNWNIQQNDRSNLYSMVILNITKDTVIRLQTTPSARILDENTIYRGGKWPGGLYYKMIERKNGPKNLYTLLSWDGFSPDANRKTIDALTFDSDGMPVFGNPIFKTKNGLRSRAVSEYYGRASFTLHYDRQKIELANVRRSQRKIDDEIIVLDRLVPLNESLKGQSWAYVPAGNIYDAYVFLNNFWTFVEDISPRNPATEKEAPKKKEIQYDLFPPK